MCRCFWSSRKTSHRGVEVLFSILLKNPHDEVALFHCLAPPLWSVIPPRAKQAEYLPVGTTWFCSPCRNISWLLHLTQSNNALSTALLCLWGAREGPGASKEVLFCLAQIVALCLYLSPSGLFPFSLFPGLIPCERLLGAVRVTLCECRVPFSLLYDVQTLNKIFSSRMDVFTQYTHINIFREVYVYISAPKKEVTHQTMKG